MLNLLIQAATAAEPHLTFMGVLRGIPHDAAAVFVYLLSVVSVGWVFIAGRKKGAPTSPTGPTESTRPTESTGPAK